MKYDENFQLILCGGKCEGKGVYGTKCDGHEGGVLKKILHEKGMWQVQERSPLREKNKWREG